METEINNYSNLESEINNYSSIPQTKLPEPFLTNNSQKNSMPRYASIGEDIWYDLNEFINSENIKTTFISLKKRLKEAELSKLVAFTHTLETDPDTLEKLMKLANEVGYKCTILWLIPQPFDALPEKYKPLGMELFRLTMNSHDVLGIILDASRYNITVKDLMDTLKIDMLPALVISEDIIDLKTPSIRNGIILKRGAIDRLIEHNKMDIIVQNIPIWARNHKLKNKAEWEANLKPLIEDLFNKIEDFISFIEDFISFKVC